MKQRLKRSAGFTLLELLVVVIIIGILASVALPQFAKMTKQARFSEAKSVVGSIMTAEMVYYQENGKFTTAFTELLTDLATSTPTYDYSVTSASTTQAVVLASGKSSASTLTVTGTINGDGTQSMGTTG